MKIRMAQDIMMQLSDMFEPVTDSDINGAKNYVLRRDSAARGLAHLIDALLADAAEEIARIAYRYGIDTERFEISSSYNDKMMEEMAKVFDDLEEDILDLTCAYATKCTEDKDKKPLLLLWVLALGRNNKGLRKTLEDRLWTFSRDIEAMLVAVKKAGRDLTKAISRIKSYLHAVYTMPEMKTLFSEPNRYKATYIRTQGVKHGNVGSSNSEANNIDRFVKTTVQMAWMHYQHELYEEKGAAGYYVLRGSTYPCDLCDSKVGFHTMDDIDGYPPFHPNCCCFAVPVYEKDINDLTI